MRELQHCILWDTNRLKGQEEGTEEGRNITPPPSPEKVKTRNCVVSERLHCAITGLKRLGK